MSFHECLECGNAVATNTTTAGPFEVPPKIVCVDCGVVMDCDPNVTVDMSKVKE